MANLLNLTVFLRVQISQAPHLGADQAVLHKMLCVFSKLNRNTPLPCPELTVVTVATIILWVCV